MGGQTIEAQWVEIIRVRLADKADAGKEQRVFSELLNSTADGIPTSFTPDLFKSAFVQTDWSIHLSWCNRKDESAFSPLGTYLFWTLQALGIVNHSIWEKYS